MKKLFLLVLLFHYETFNNMFKDSDDTMIARANELSRLGITHIYLYPSTYGHHASIIWAEETK